MTRTLFAGLVAMPALLLGSPAAHAETPAMTPEVTVRSTFPGGQGPGFLSLLPQDLPLSYGADGGAFLASVPGVTTSRMGGHGADPVIHGQQQTQLNIINDGAMTHGGCPNRMDPPSSFVTPETYDEVKILKGYQTVRYGAGGSGGTVLFERNPAPLSSAGLSGIFAAGGTFESNANLKSGYADATAGTKQAQLRAVVSQSSADNYQDGDGVSVRSGFSAESATLMPVWTPDARTTVRAAVELSRTDDVLYAGAGMDSPEGSALTHSFNFEREVDLPWLTKMSASFYNSEVDHVMDNYSLRSNSGMKMKAPSESATYGGRLEGAGVLGGIPFVFGLDMQNNNRDAWRYSGAASATEATSPQARLWPDVRIHQTGLYAEMSPQMGEALHLTIGGRYDRVEARAKDTETAFGSASPDSLYLSHYGVSDPSETEHNLGGLVRASWDVQGSTSLFAGLSRSVRTADATERYLAANSATASSRWIGNPDLSPEKHHQLDLGIQTGAPDRSLTVSGFYDRVDDFILRDVARGQSGVLVSTGATVYRNIDAVLAGLEAEGRYRFFEEWTLLGNVVFTYGNNRDDHDSLAQIAPLQGRLALEYAPGSWVFGTRLNVAARQSHIDDQTSLRDVGKTPGYGTLDFYTRVELQPFELRLGVTNLFDKRYALHLNRSNAFEPEEIQVNEPGRSIGLQFSARF